MDGAQTYQVSVNAVSENCTSCSLAAGCLPKGLPWQQWRQLDALARHPAVFVRRQRIYSQNAPFYSCYIVKSGAVKTVCINAQGQERVLGLYLPGDLFGLDGVGDGSHTCSAQALERSLICRINFADLEQHMARMPKLQRLLLQLMSDQLNAAHGLICSLSQSTAEERVVRFILELSDRYRQRKLSGTEFRLAMTKTDAANYLGLAVETLSRVLGRLRNRGLIRIQGRQLQILNEAALKAIADPSHIFLDS